MKRHNYIIEAIFFHFSNIFMPFMSRCLHNLLLVLLALLLNLILFLLLLLPIFSRNNFWLLRVDHCCFLWFCRIVKNSDVSIPTAGAFSHLTNLQWLLVKNIYIIFIDFFFLSFLRCLMNTWNLFLGIIRSIFIQFAGNCTTPNVTMVI